MHIVIVSHVPPWPARAGNEYRLARLMSWLESCGYEVHFVYHPVGDTSPPEADLTGLLERYPRTYVIDPDNHSLTVGAPGTAATQALLTHARRKPIDHTRRLAADDVLLERKTLDMTRQFAPEPVIALVQALTQALRPVAVIAEYIFMSPVMPFVDNGPLRIIDLIDAFSTKAAKVERYGVNERLIVTDADEARLIRRADVAIAIQPEETELISRLVPDRKVITVPIDFPVSEATVAATDRRVLIVASDNPLNVNGLHGFLRYCWPLVLARHPDALLDVVGSVGKTLSGAETGVRVLGRVDDINDAYAACRVAINPAIAGTGIKVKTLEAIAHLRPIVVWPNGAEGLAPDLRTACSVVTDWVQFADAVCAQLGDAGRIAAPPVDADRVRQALSPEVVYAELRAVLDDAQRVASGATQTVVR